MVDLRQKAALIVEILDECYPMEEECYLRYGEPYELLFATILSAQCTDERVNMVTEVLFKKYPTLTAFAQARQDELEEDVRPTGFYHSKARNIILSARQLLLDGGEVPSDIERLTALPGVGRKTANVVRGHIFRIPSIVVDTHVKRVSKKLGLTAWDDPQKVERDLMEVLPQEHWIRYNLQIIAHGRKVCRARGPNCAACCFAALCVGIKR